MLNKNDNIIAYRRVSSDEQAKGYSLDVQSETFKRYQKVQDFKIVLDISEDFSAKSFNRPEIKNIEAFVKKNKGLVTKFIVTKWDRFARDTSGAYAQIDWFNKHGIEVNALEQPIDWSNPEQRVMLAIYLSAPEAENLRRGANVRAGMRKGMLEGRWLITPPRGYNKILDSNRKPLLVKSDDAPLVVNAFELYGSGNYSQREALKIMQAKGLKMQKSQFSRMLTNVAYIGKIRVSAWSIEPEQIVDAIHEPLISAELFLKVQELLTGKQTVAAGKVRTPKEDLPLRGFLRCKCCGSKLTGSASRGNGGTYFYYHCHLNCPQERYRADNVNSLFTDLLDRVQIPSEVTDLYYEVVRDILKTNDQERQTTIEKTDKDIEKYRQKIENVQDLFADDSLSLKDYNDMKTRYEKSYNELILERTKYSMQKSEFDKYLKWGFVFMGNVKAYYQNANVKVKQQIIGSMFPNLFEIEENKLRTTGTNEMIGLITRIDAGFKEKKSGQSAFKRKMSAIAERMGFELSDRR